jgi:hypothetical protein
LWQKPGAKPWPGRYDVHRIGPRRRRAGSEALPDGPGHCCTRAS